MTVAVTTHSGEAQIIRSREPIQSLEFEETRLAIQLDEAGTVERPYVMLNGRFKARDGTLTVSSQGNTPIRLDQGERFKFRVYLKSGLTEFGLAEVDALGHVRHETVEVRFDSWKDFRNDLELDFKREFVFTPSLGITSTHYTQEGTDGYRAILITPKFTINYRYAPRWSVAANTFFSALALGSSIPGFTMRFIGVNGRIGYQLSSIRDPWTLTLSTGIYYLTTLVSEDIMGFTNVMGPQFIANIRYRKSDRDSIIGYVKFAPMGESFYLRKLSDHEVALGVGWARTFKEGKHVGSILIDWADFGLTVDSVQVNNRSLSLSVAYSL